MMIKRITIAIMFAVAASVPDPAAADRPPLEDTPIVWFEDDRNSIEQPSVSEPDLTLEYFESSWGRPRERLTDPVRIIRRIGGIFGNDHVPPADNINTLDEVPNSTWFTNRIGLFPMTPEQAASGPGSGETPDTGDTWVVVSAKTEGVTPGFNIRDAKGNVYLLKFDPPGCLCQTSGACVISSRIFHAAGYNVPYDAVVTFEREDIIVGDDVMFDGSDGERPMTEADIDTILSRVDKLPTGEWRALSSKYLDGIPIGPSRWTGRRKDDPNDRIKHENRRELRGLYVLSAWLNHFDVKRHNTLDMFVTEGDRTFVRHHLIDFASTIGAGAKGPNPRYGYEYTFDPKAMIRRTATLGLVEDRWRKRTRDHGFAEVGYWDSDYFKANEFRPTLPNDLFANTTDRDGYWGAKIVGAFSDTHLKAIVEEAQYREPGAAEYVVGILTQNRDIVVRYFFDRVAPLDFFSIVGGEIHFQDLGDRYGVYPGTQPRYRVRCAAVDKNRSADKQSKTQWVELAKTALTLDSGPAAEALAASDASRHPFLSMEFQVNRGEGWSSSVKTYLARDSRRIIAVDR
ncbi:MAG: hypothetical protein JSW50_09975 [Candidatus Latescibacterota bacterium]|nr:MAG: hypothetical protein JSW50_09975 [Candidatus Latescibacterota bacterium]